MHIHRFYVLISFLLTLSSCATMPHQQFEKIEPGMDKSQVIDLMGTPQYTLRGRAGESLPSTPNENVDRWFYQFYKDQQMHEVEVQFHKSHVVYRGQIRQPNVNATEQDLKNDKQIQDSQAQQAQLKSSIRNTTIHSESENKLTNPNNGVPQFDPIE